MNRDVHSFQLINPQEANQQFNSGTGQGKRTAFFQVMQQRYAAWESFVSSSREFRDWEWSPCIDQSLLRPGQGKWLLLDNLAHYPAPNTLSAHRQLLMLTTWQLDFYGLQIGFEFSSCDTRNLGTNTAQVFGFTPNLYSITNRSLLTTDRTLTGHSGSLNQSFALFSTLSANPSTSGDSPIPHLPSNSQSSHSGYWELSSISRHAVDTTPIWRAGRSLAFFQAAQA